MNSLCFRCPKDETTSSPAPYDPVPDRIQVALAPRCRNALWFHYAR